MKRATGKALGGLLMPKGDRCMWIMRDGTFETERLLSACPMCGAIGSITALPPPLLAKETDGTTHVCNPGLGGCNQGFAK